MIAANMTIDGVGSEPMVQPAVMLYAQACGLGEQVACDRVVAHASQIATWFDDALVAATPTAYVPPPPEAEPNPSPGDSAGPVVDPAPPPAPLEQPPTRPAGADTAIAKASEILDLYGPRLDQRWREARTVALLDMRIAGWQLSAARSLLEDRADAIPDEARERVEARMTEIDVLLTLLAEAESEAKAAAEAAEAAEQEASVQE
jgi:hypothetical protein